MKASGAAPDPSIEDMPLEDPSGALSIPQAWKPSGALSNPDPNIGDMPLEEYNQSKGAFFQPCAKDPKMDGGHQCSLFEREEYPEDGFYQDAKAKRYGEKQDLPILSVSGCMFICKCRCVCVLLIVHI